MADPISWTMLAGAAISAVGAVSQANAAKAASTYNTRLRERDATLAVNQSTEDARRFAQRTAQDQGTLLAGYGASGVATDTGSPLDVLRTSVANAKLDEGTILYKGRLREMGYLDEATLNRLSGDTAEQQGYLTGASYLLTGVGRSAATYQAGRRPLRSGVASQSTEQSTDITAETEI